MRRDVTGSLVQPPAQSRANTALGPLKPSCLQAEEAQCFHPLLTQHAPPSWSFWLPPLDSIQFIIAFPCLDVALKTQSKERWVEEHNHFTLSTGSVPVVQPSMLQLVSDKGIWIVLRPMLMFVQVIFMGEGIVCVCIFKNAMYLLFVPGGSKMLNY